GGTEQHRWAPESASDGAPDAAFGAPSRADSPSGLGGARGCAPRRKHDQFGAAWTATISGLSISTQPRISEMRPRAVWAGVRRLAAYGLADPGRGPVGHEHSAGQQEGPGLCTRDVPGEGERRPV